MNFVFISPQFPHTYWNFCDRLKRRGVNVLGIGDTPYDQLDENVKRSLTEYYWVDNMEDYDKMLRAVGFFTFKYGKIDWIESNNEYWLEQDAKLRTDFHVTTGVQASDIERYKSKAEMKTWYAAGKVPTARQGKAESFEAAERFIKEVGYPVIAKPEVGVGATYTWKLENDGDLARFFREKPDVPYVLEEFVTGDIYSYDAIINDSCEPVFESMTCWPPSIMDIVEKQLDLAYYVSGEVDAKLRDLGRRTVKAFDVHNRFVHLEFFRLTKARKGLGKVGDFAGLEVNMRPAGGYTPDMMNFAHSTDVYEIWAEMVTDGKRTLPDLKQEYSCVYAGRRDGVSYVHSHEEIREKYGQFMVMEEPLPPMMVPQMGNYMYTARLKDEEEARAFIRFVTERK